MTTSSSLFGGWKIHIFQSWKPSHPLQEAYLRDAVDGGDRKTLTFESWQRRRGSIQVFVEAFSRNTVVRNTKYEVGCTGEGARRSNSIKGPTEVKIDDTDFSLPPSLPLCIYGGAIDYRPIRTPASARELDLIPPTIAALLSIQHFSPPPPFQIHPSFRTFREKQQVIFSRNSLKR